MLCNYRIHYEYKYNYNLIVFTESGNKYHYPHIEADSLQDAIIVVKEFFEDDYPDEVFSFAMLKNRTTLAEEEF